MFSTKWIINPFLIYVFSFLFCIVVYLFGWSSSYPVLSLSFILFFSFTFIVSFYLGIIVYRYKEIEFKPIIESNAGSLIFILILFGYLMEFYNNKGIPLLMIFNGIDYDYRLFGIKSFHVILLTFHGFYSVYLFHQLLSKFSLYKLLYFLVLLLLNVLIMNRGALIITLIQCAFLTLLYFDKIRTRLIFLAVLFFIVFSYFFGYVGNLRSAHGDNKYIPRVNGATSTFLESKVPNEYFWMYLYISSPLANFQNSIYFADTQSSLKEKKITIINCFLPSFITKRLIDVESRTKKSHLIHMNLTVCTIFNEMYLYFDWFGPIIMFLYLIAFSFIYLIIIPSQSRYFITSLVLLCSFMLFNTFDNMFSFSGLSLQLFYPVLFMILEKMKFIL